jgi:hypothetical protein
MVQQSLYIGTDRPAITLFYVIFLGAPLKSFASDTALDHIFSQQCKSKQLLKTFLEKMDFPKNILQHSVGPERMAVLSISIFLRLYQ